MHIVFVRSLILASICGLAVSLGMTRTAHDEELPLYRPQAPVSGTIRIWGSLDDGRLIEELETGFRKYEPAVRFQNTLHGPESIFAAVYMDVADLGFMAREMRVPIERTAFEWVHHYPPFEVEVANAGLRAASGADRPEVNLAFFVNKANPLSCVTLRELDDIFAADHRRGGTNIRYWGELQLGGAWASRPVHVYGPDPENVSAIFIRRSIFDDSRVRSWKRRTQKWNPGYRIEAGQWSDLLEKLARDPDGISFAPLLPGYQGVKALQVAASRQTACYPLTRETVEARKYPLTRTVDVALDRPPGSALKPAAREFLRFILSREGQRIIVADGAYLPLSATTLRQQRQRVQ